MGFKKVLPERVSNMAEQSTSSTRKTSGKNRKGSILSGRYRTIIIAIACFLLFDLGVLILNFYTSFQIKEDALGINLAGRQRMLSQRTIKALLIVSGEPQTSSQRNLAELKEATAMFDTTLQAFQSGGIVTGGDGQATYLKAVQDPQTLSVLQKASEIWAPYYRLLQPVLENTATPEQEQQVMTYALEHNTQLLHLMNELTTALELQAENRASFLRMVQTVGIILALLNFAFILYKFIHQLRKSDDAIEIVNAENREILNTVQEGLFLVTPSCRIGSQISTSASALFGQKINPGDDFFEILAPRVSAKVLHDAQEYLKLLLSPHIKDHLVRSINPLSEVEVQVTNRLQIQKNHYLAFSFSRVMDKKSEEVQHLLVTIQDITHQIELEAKLRDERYRSQKEFSMLLKAMEADPVELRSFIEQTEKSLLYVNDLLRETSDSKTQTKLAATLDEIARIIHAIKGNASALNLDSVCELAHTFESELKEIKDIVHENKPIGESLLALPIPLGNLLSIISTLKTLFLDAAATSTNADSEQEPSPRIHSPLAINPLDNKMLTRLVNNASEDHNKNAQLNIACDDGWDSIPMDTARLVREIVIQLVRNAIVHGLETPEERAAGQKPEAGNIDIRLKRVNSNGWFLSVRDDGTGLQVDRIRQKLLKLGWFNQKELDGMSNKEIALQIFRPDFSTAQNITMHAGRGSGLDLVVNNINQLNKPHLNVSSRPGLYTEFALTFSV